MNSVKLYFLLLSIASTSWATESVHITGSITDVSDQPVQGATVRIEKTNCIASTGSDGSFSIQCDPSAILAERLKPDGFSVFMSDNALSVNLPSSRHVRIDRFDLCGRYTGTLVDGILRAGLNTTVVSKASACQMHVLRCRIGRAAVQLKCIAGSHFSNASSSMQASAAPRGIAAAPNGSEPVIGTMVISHPLFATQKIAINPRIDTTLSITLVAAQANWVFALDKECADQNAGVAATRNGVYMVLGLTHSPAGDYDMGIIMLDSSGSAVVKHRYGGSESEIAYAFGITMSDEIRIFGTYGMMPPASMFYSTHLSQRGDSLGTMILTSNPGLTQEGGAVTDDGGYVLAGYSYGVDAVSGHNISDAVVVRFSASDELLWRKNYTIEYYTISLDIIALQQGGFILAGSYYDTLARDTKLFLKKLDENGNALKQIIFSDLHTAQYRQIVETSDHRILFLGRTKCNARDCPYLAWLSADLAVERDSVIIDPTIQIPCMAKLADNTFVLACRAIPVRGSDSDFEFERIKLINIDVNGRQLREKIVSEECGHPLSVSAGRDGSIVVSGATGDTFLKQKFYIVNVPW